MFLFYIIINFSDFYFYHSFLFFILIQNFKIN